MSTIKSSDEHLTLNADGSSKDIKFQANGVEKASLSSTGVFTATSFAGDGSNLTGAGATHTSSGSAPGSPAIGDFWHDTTNDRLYIRTNDGSSNIWLQI